MSKARNFTISLTAREAKLLWGFIDGCADAGACEGGNTQEESKVLSKMTFALLAHMQKGDAS